MTTRANIRSLARIRADQTNSTFPSDTEYNTLINVAARQVHNKLLRAGWAPHRDVNTITLNGAATYTLPTNLDTIVDVQYVAGTGDRRPLKPVKPEDRANYLAMGTGEPQVYEQYLGTRAAGRIVFFPRPSSGTVEVTFTETFSEMTLDADEWYGPNGSADLIALGAAILALDKEGVDTSKLEREYDKLLGELCDQAHWRDQQGVHTVRDARGSGAVDPFDWNVSEGWY